MEVKQLHCPNCGSSLHIVEGLDVVTCPACSTQLVVTQSDDQIMLQMGATISEAIADSHAKTHDAIEQSVYVTREELRRVQMTQQYSSLRLILANLRSEIRELERSEPSRRRAKELQQLRIQERNLQAEMLELQRILEPDKVVAEPSAPSPKPSYPKSGGEVVKWVLLWPFLVAALLWRQGGVGKFAAVVWAFFVWPLYITLPLAICGVITGGSSATIAPLVSDLMYTAPSMIAAAC